MRMKVVPRRGRPAPAAARAAACNHVMLWKSPCGCGRWDLATASRRNRRTSLAPPSGAGGFTAFGRRLPQEMPNAATLAQPTGRGRTNDKSDARRAARRQGRLRPGRVEIGIKNEGTVVYCKRKHASRRCTHGLSPASGRANVISRPGRSACLKLRYHCHSLRTSGNRTGQRYLGRRLM